MSKPSKEDLSEMIEDVSDSIELEVRNLEYALKKYDSQPDRYEPGTPEATLIENTRNLVRQYREVKEMSNGTHQSI